MDAMEAPRPHPDWVPPAPVVARPPLRRADAHSADMPAPLLAGVCSALAVHLGLPVRIVRLAFVPLAFAGVGIFFYLWLLVMVPKDDGSGHEAAGVMSSGLARVGRDRSSSVTRSQLFLLGVLFLTGAVVALLLLMTNTLDPRDVAGLALVLVGVTLVWSQGTNPRNWRTARFIVSVVAGVLVVVIGVMLLLAQGDPLRSLIKGGAIGVIVVAVVLITLAPLWLRTSSELTSAREQQVRDAERADIAAHIHDSVLQTLTLVRSAADDPVRVRALALSQERELRSWLYTGREATADSFTAGLREAVGQVEDVHGQRVEVVTVGEAWLGPAELALVAASAEAVTNAVRHGAPPVSVYAEVGSGVVDVWVKDCGSGFDLSAVPADRHGVRGSIMGRVERAGGHVEFRCREQGTEVHMRVPRTLSEGVPGAVPSLSRTGQGGRS